MGVCAPRALRYKMKPHGSISLRNTGKEKAGRERGTEWEEKACRQAVDLRIQPEDNTHIPRPDLQEGVPMHKTRTREAFTLIELLIVVAIIGILAAIAVPNFLIAQTKAKIGRMYTEHNAMNTAMMMYRLDYN